MNALQTPHPDPILPVAYFGPAVYFALLLHWPSDSIPIEVTETYPKQTWRNRCTILTAQGTLNLTIPVIRPQGNHTLISAVQPDPSSRWATLHQRAIHTSYDASPFLMYYGHHLFPIMNDSSLSLTALNISLTRKIMQLLKMEKEIVAVSAFKAPEDDDDFRLALSPKRRFAENLFPAYTQVYSDKLGFHPNLSILDILFNLGPQSTDYLKKVAGLLFP